MNEFLNWLNIDEQSLSWEGKNISDVHQLWKTLFSKDEFYEETSRVVNRLNSSPLRSWFEWLVECRIIYDFEQKNINLVQLANLSRKSLKSVSYLLTSYYSRVFSNKIEPIQEFFSYSHLQSEHLAHKGADFLSLIQTSSFGDNYQLESQFRNIEISLLEGWEELDVKVEPLLHFKKVVRPKARSITFLRELVFLFLIGGVLIVGTKYANSFYEEYLLKKISLLEKDFFWLDTKLTYRDNTQSDSIGLSSKQLEQLELKENNLSITEKFESTRFEDESDVMVTSLNELPQDFDIAKGEQSDYEEIKKGGYRDLSYGGRKVYRVMVTAPNTDKVLRRVNTLLSKIKFKKVDSVEPGKEIPGGIYYNLYIPRENLKEFLGTLKKETGGTILESKTVSAGLKNMNKVFIFIKKV